MEFAPLPELPTVPSLDLTLAFDPLLMSDLEASGPFARGDLMGKPAAAAAPAEGRDWMTLTRDLSGDIGLLQKPAAPAAPAAPRAPRTRRASRAKKAALAEAAAPAPAPPTDSGRVTKRTAAAAAAAAAGGKKKPKRIRPTIDTLRERQDKRLQDLTERNTFLKTVIGEATTEIDKIKQLVLLILQRERDAAAKADHHRQQ